MWAFLTHSHTLCCRWKMNKVREREEPGRAHEKWSCLISRAAAAVSFIHNQVKVSYLHGMAL